MLQTNEGRGTLPLINELAAIYLGAAKVSPEADSEFKTFLNENLNQFKDFNVIYKQNTANEVNVVVPDYLMLESQEFLVMTNSQLEKISGGAFEIAVFLGGLGAALGVGTIITSASGAAVVGVVATGVGGVTIGYGIASVAAGAAVIAAGVIAGGAVLAGVGVGVAAGLGAFNSGGSGPISVGLVE